MLAAATWPEVPTGATVLVPVGSTEQHGPHLPLETDTIIAEAVCNGTAAVVGALVAPPITFGSSYEHQSFPGTASIGTAVLTSLFVELARSMRTWSGPVLFVNGHGGSPRALDEAVEQLRTEGHVVSWAPCSTDDVDLHAGHAETSLLLHVRPDLVRLDRAQAGDPRPLRDVMPSIVADGMAAVSPNGVLGDPRDADGRYGADLLRSMIENAVDACILLRGSRSVGERDPR
jgi:mycofactocin precursor peptide peptidase